MTARDEAQSYQGGAALLQIVAASLPTVGLLGLLLAATSVWQHFRPVGFPDRSTGLERALIETQLERDHTIAREVDVLLLGDSSGLMGIDPQLLGERLGGARVESLCTMGFVGPRGHALLLKRYLAERGHPGLVLIVLHPTSLEWNDAWIPFEQMAIGGIPPPAVPVDIGAAVQARLLAVAEPFLYIPMKGPMGDYYGSPLVLAEFMRTHQGSAVEPAPPLPKTAYEKGLGRWGRFSVNKTFMDRLPALAEAVDQLGPSAVRIVLMPMAACYSSPKPVARSRALALPVLYERLHLDPGSELELPAILPGPMFGTTAHLNPVGRRYFTRRLADALAKDRARRTSP